MNYAVPVFAFRSFFLTQKNVAIDRKCIKKRIIRVENSDIRYKVVWNKYTDIRIFWVVKYNEYNKAEY